MIIKIKPNIFQFHFMNFGSAVYLIQLDTLNKKQNILIDTSSKENKRELLTDLEQLTLSPSDINIIILTHKHWDHDGNINLFPNAKQYTFNNLNEFPIKQFKIIKTPGHTKDSIAILYEDILFSGDTLFHNGIGRTDFPESEPEKMKESLKTLKLLNYKTLCPGHL